MTSGPSLWNRNFLLLYQGGVVSALGDQAYLIAILLWTKESTASASTVGYVLFAGGITGLLMPLGGALSDRFSRARMLVLLDAVSGICVLTMAALLWQLPPQHPALIPLVLTIAVIRGICMALFYPVEAALIPDLVGERSLTQANSLLESTSRLTVLIGQGFGGLLFRLLGAPLLLLFDGMSFLLSAVSELFIQEPVRVHLPAGERRGLRRDLSDGFRYTARVRGFRIYLLEASCANFFLTALTVSLPFYVEDVLQASADWYGYLLGGMGFGAIVGGIVAGRFRQPGVARGTVQILGLVGFSGCLLPLSLVRSPWVALAILMSAWACVGFHQVILTTLVQRRTPAAMRGRIFGLLAMIRQGLTPLGAALVGMLIDALNGRVTGVLFWAGIAGMGTVLVAALHPDYRWFFTGDEQEVGS